MTYYVGILDGDGKTWGVRVPDLPGCHGGGATPDEAAADATSAVRVWIAHQVACKAPVPKPRSLMKVLKDPSTEFDATNGEAAVMIPALLDDGRAVRANVSLDAGLLEAIDAEAKRRGLTRSAFLASAAREKITQAR